MDKISVIERLHRTIPLPNKVRVAGILEQIRYSNHKFSILLENGKEVTGVAEGIESERMIKHFGKRVIVTGVAHYQLSGNVRRIDAIEIGPATGDISLWSEEPKPSFSNLGLEIIKSRVIRKKGLQAIVGKWPGDETDEEIERALLEIS